MGELGAVSSGAFQCAALAEPLGGSDTLAVGAARGG
jgi:hypothetical protein